MEPDRNRNKTNLNTGSMKRGERFLYSLACRNVSIQKDVQVVHISATFLFLEFAAFPAMPAGSTMFSMEPTALKIDSGYIFYLSIKGIKK
jgi:hypothetical protein